MQRHPCLCFRRGETEVRWHNANDLTAYTLELDGAANNIRVFLEALFPEAMAQDHCVVLANTILAGIKDSPQFRPRTQNRKQFSGDQGASQADWLFTSGQIELVALGVATDVHRMNLLTHRNQRALRIRAGHADQLLGLAIRQRHEEDSVHQAEDSCVGSDA